MKLLQHIFQQSLFSPNHLEFNPLLVVIIEVDNKQVLGDFIALKHDGDNGITTQLVGGGTRCFYEKW